MSSTYTMSRVSNTFEDRLKNKVCSPLHCFFLEKERRAHKHGTPPVSLQNMTIGTKLNLKGYKSQGIDVALFP